MTWTEYFALVLTGVAGAVVGVQILGLILGPIVAVAPLIAYLETRYPPHEQE